MRFKLLLLMWFAANLNAALADPIRGLADELLIKKSEKKLYLLRDGKAFREYRIALGPRPRGHKQSAGDERTPEGRYYLDFKNENSEYYKSIRISYPDSEDIAQALLRGDDPGGQIMIHGTPNHAKLPESFIQQYNWTDGCIAVTNREMDEIWSAVQPGTPIEILP